MGVALLLTGIGFLVLTLLRRQAPAEARAQMRSGEAVPATG